MPQIKHDLTRTVLAVAHASPGWSASRSGCCAHSSGNDLGGHAGRDDLALLGRLERAFGNRRGLAVTVMTLALLLLLVVPMWAAIDTLADNSGRIAGWARRSLNRGCRRHRTSWHGFRLSAKRSRPPWAELAAAGPESLVGRLAPYAAGVGKWVVAEAGSVGFVFVRFLLVVALSAVMYANGEVAAAKVRRLGRRWRVIGRELGDPCRPGYPRRRHGRRRNGNCPDHAGWNRSRRRRRAVRGFPGALMLMFCIAQLGPGLILFSGGCLALLERRFDLGNRAVGLEPLRDDPGQLPAPFLDQAGGGFAAAAHLRRRHWGMTRFWTRSGFHRPGRAGRDLYAARGVDRRCAGRADDAGTSGPP